MFTDAHLTGELSTGYGPYQFFNTVPVGPPGLLKPGVVLRVAEHLQFEPGTIDFSKTNTERYHGGSLVEELAALLSLSLGIRLKAAGSNRRFDSSGDPKGRPHAWAFHNTPVLLKSDLLASRLPFTTGTHSLNDDQLLTTLPLLSPEQANAVVRAARLYQDSIWLAEAEPHLAWLMLVSAVESAANYWRSSEDPVERLKEDIPDLVSALEDSGGAKLVEQVARILSIRIGATKSFVDFLAAFLPPPPPNRPPQWAQVSWDLRDLRRSFRKIYSWRSQALHGGTPFPQPMCNPPHRVDEHFAEKPTGTASSQSGGVWLADDTPMLIHTFEYIARGALGNWWRSFAETSPSGA
jgi:hypothetical protein